tara:strand:+ start:2894 stop:3400 length:507 start_codon:yes stop_codon:yes gene_type:complete
MITISHVVALSNNRVIGVDNDLPWRLKKDLAHFKAYTTNKIIIMGRKTFESIGRPLPNRINFVVSTTITEIEGAQVFKSTKEALSEANKLCIELNYKEIVIIGGGYLFRDTLSVVNKLVLTEVDCEIDGDVYYPDIDLDSWQNTETSEHEKDQENEFDFKVLVYEKVK